MWSVPGNWSCPGGPAAGNDLIFPNAGANKSMIDDISVLSVNSLLFSEGGGGYSVSGAGNLTLTGATAIISRAVNSNTNALSLTNPVKFGNLPSAIIDTTAAWLGMLNLNGPLDLNGGVLKFVWDSTPSVHYTTVNGAITGAGGLSIDGAVADYALKLNGNSAFTGPVTLNSAICSSVTRTRWVPAARGTAPLSAATRRWCWMRTFSPNRSISGPGAGRTATA